MPCNRVISSSYHLFYLLIWCFIPTMTSVQEKNRGSLPVVAMPLSETCPPVATQSSQEGLASLWRYLQYITNCAQKLKTASESLPQGRTGPVFVLKVKFLSAFFKCALTFPKQFPFPTQFYSAVHRALFHKHAFKQCPSTICRTAELCNLRMCSAQHSHHQMGNDKN